MRSWAVAESQNVFADVPHSARGHLGILFHAAAYRLIYFLRARSAPEGSLDDIFREHPFLAVYFEEIRSRLPEEIGWQDSLIRMRDQIVEWQSQSSESLPLVAMCETLGLQHEGLLAFVLAGMVEEQAEFGAVFASLQQPPGERRVRVGLVQEIFECGQTPEAWPIIRPLLDAGFLQACNEDAPRSGWILRVPMLLWNAVRGECGERPLVASQYCTQESLKPLEDLVVDERARQQLGELPERMRAGRVRTIVLRGMPGTDRWGSLGALARALGYGILQLECAASSAPDERWRLAGPLCTLTRAMPVFSLEAAPGETFEIPALAGYNGPCAVMLGREGGVRGSNSERAFTIQLELESVSDRLKLWERSLKGSCEVTDVALSLCLPARYIRQCSQLALDYAAVERRPRVSVEDLQRAARSLNRQTLDTLATRIEGAVSWAHLIVQMGTARELEILAGRCRHRERIAETFASSMPGGMNRGVRALFEGASGTGKTLAARVLATELGFDLYRVDLAAVVNKYIGETEKNLSRVLGRAEDLNVILLLDEGDSLMTRRTDVKSANDRYANLETNYLLQRLEHYTGIVIVTTNVGHAIDTAFRRRMDSVVKFHLPDAGERWRLWQAHLPPQHAIDSKTLEQIALRYELTGGQIRNVCVHAALLMLDRGADRLSQAELTEALQNEHRKAGASFVANAPAAKAQNRQSIAAFVGGLS
jgi:hypothetical protein